MEKLIDIFDEERICEYRGEVYTVRDNGAVMRYPREGKKPRPLDNKWTFGTINTQKGYTMIASEPVHRIVATAFLGEPPTDKHVVDHIDTNRLICNDCCQEAISPDSGFLRDLPTEGISKEPWNQISGIGHSDIRGFGGCRTSTLPTG